MESAVEILATYEDPYTRITLRADGILCFYATPGMVITLERAKCLLNAGLSLVDGPMPTIVHMEDVARVDREARSFFASDDYVKLARQTALIVGSPVTGRDRRTSVHATASAELQTS